MRRTQIYLEKHQELVLQSLAAKRKTSVAQLIREAIDQAYMRAAPIDDALATLDACFGGWKREETGAEYVERIRPAGNWWRKIEGYRTRTS